MSLEAAAGKNPVSHVGKIYNILAERIAETAVTTIPQVSAAQCLIVSRIGAPVSMPTLVHLKMATRDGSPLEALRERTAEAVADHLGRIPELVGELVAGEIHVF
jgi:S-adenosylmethionine synthetase